MKGNVGGFEHSAEADINELRQKLKGYGSQEAFLEEILQNTDDAGAALQRIAWIPGREESHHPLLRGPALALINDKPLKPSEVRAIRRMGLGTKGATQQVIGKFGQGIKTIFQVCEAFFFLSRNPEIGGNAPDVLWLCNPWRGWHHDEWNRFEEEDAAEILRRTTGLLPEGPWFLLYLPLRRDVHLGSGDQRVQPILESHEGDTLYDQRRRIVFTSKGLPGVGLPRAEWNEVKALRTGTVTRTVLDTTLPTGPVERQIIYQAPFTKSDRETDYATVWERLDEREKKR